MTSTPPGDAAATSSSPVTAGPAAGVDVSGLADAIAGTGTPDSGPDNRSADGAVLRYAKILAVGAGANLGKVQTDATGVTWLSYDAAYLPTVGDFVYLLQQGPVTHVGGKLGGSPTSVLIGEIKAYAGAAAPAGWMNCNGAAVSRTTYAALFAVVGTTYGAGDGATTFNLPNLVDRVPTGSGALFARGEAGGSETRTLTTANLPSHTHGHTATHDHSGIAVSHTHTAAALPIHDHPGTAMGTHDHAGVAHSHTAAHDHAGSPHSHTVDLHYGTTRAVTGGTGAFAYAGSGSSSTTSSVTVNVAAYNGSTGSATAGVAAASAGTPNVSSASAGTPTINAASITPNVNAASPGPTDATGGGASFNNMPPYLGVLYIIRAAA